MQTGTLVLERDRSPFFEIEACGPDDREYNPAPRPVTASAETLALLRGRVVPGLEKAKPFRRGLGHVKVGLSAGDKAAMVVRYRAGESYRDLADFYCVPDARVREILVAAGVDIRAPGRGKVVEVVEGVEMPLGLGSVVDGGNESEIVKECAEMARGPAVVVGKNEEQQIVARYVAGEPSGALAKQYKMGMRRLRKMVEAHGEKWRGNAERVSGVGSGRSNGNGVKKDAAAQSSVLSPSSPPTPPVDAPLPPEPDGSEPVRMVVESEELEVRPVARRAYEPPAITRTGQLRPVEPISLLQPRPDETLGEVLVQLGRLNSLIQELRSIDGAHVAGSVSISLSIEVGL